MMANSRQHKFLCLSALICAKQSQFVISLGGVGDTWMLIGLIYFIFCLNLSFLLISYRKGLNFKETAYAVKKYSSHHRVPEANEVWEALEALRRKREVSEIAQV